MRLILLLCLFFSPLFSSEFVLLPEDKVYKGDYFAAGDSVEIAGRVLGDVYAISGHLIINGEVDGDVIISGGSLSIAGVVKGNVRAIGGQIDLAGTVGKNTTLIGGNVQISTSGRVQKNVIIMAANAELEGAISGDALIAASQLRMSGTIKGDLNAHVGQLRLARGARIGGRLEYSSGSEAWIDEGAGVSGDVKQLPSPVRGFFEKLSGSKAIRTSKFIGLLMNFVFSFVIGWILMKGFPKKLDACLKVLRTRPGKTLGVGLLIAIFLPILCILLLISILGAPFAIALIALNLLGFYSAKVITVLWFSERYLTKFKLRSHSLWLLFFGLILYFAAVRIPFLGRFIALGAMLFGLGALFLGRRERKLKKKRSRRSGGKG